MSQAIPQGHLIVRGRRDDDMEACERLVRATHLHDRYPDLPRGSTRSFLRRPSPLGARVAELDRTIVGQVGLRPAASKAVMTLACDRLKVTADQIGVVARLLVSPQQRRQGAGRVPAVASSPASTATSWHQSPTVACGTRHAVLP
jgi:hypothetical protein